MAVKKTIEIDVDIVGANGGLESVVQNFKKSEEAAKSLKAQLREAQLEVAELSEKFGATSKEAVQAAKRASELKDRIGDAKDLTDAFNPDAKFNALSKSLTGVASGFAAYQGALGLVGVESKDLEKQLLKVQSALAIAQGLQGLGEARDSFKQLKAVAIDAFKGIKTAIGSTGIGLLVVALGTIYAYWDDIKEVVSGVSEEQKKLNQASQKNLETQEKKLKAIGDQDEVLKLQGKSERQILEYKKQQTNEAISASQINLKNIEITNKEQEKAVKQNYEYLKS
jgi:predicted  nucleic acid-binding Zn-ribbon protein